MEREFHKMQPLDDNFEAFLNRVRYAFKKMFNCTDTRYDEFSREMKDGRTLWETIKADGQATIEDGIVSLDIDFERIIYIAIRE